MDQLCPLHVVDFGVYALGRAPPPLTEESLEFPLHNAVQKQLWFSLNCMIFLNLCPFNWICIFGNRKILEKKCLSYMAMILVHKKSVLFLFIISKWGKILQHFTLCWTLWLKVVGMYFMQVWNVRDINHIMSVFVDGWCTFSNFHQFDMMICDLNVQDFLNSCCYWNMSTIHRFVFYLRHHCERILKAFRKSQNLVSQC